MSLKIGGVDILDMKYNGAPLLGAKINDVALWPLTPTRPPPMGNLYGRMKALTSRQTITHFNTVAAAEVIKYRVYPTSYAEGVIGTLLAEAAPYSSITPETSRVPLVRGFEVVTSSHVRLRQAMGDNTVYDGGAGNDGGVNTGAASYSWGDYVGTLISGVAAIYIMDVTSRNWLRIFPKVRNSGTAGGSFFNFFLDTVDHARAVASSFDVLGSTDYATKLTKIQTWLGGIKADTKKREFVIMIAASHDIVPAF